MRTLNASRATALVGLVIAFVCAPAGAQQKIQVVSTPLTQEIVKLFPEIASGYIDFSGNIDTAIAIRTMVVCGNEAWVQAGAGVVADSVPEQEHLECENKARALLAAVPAARRMTAQRRSEAARRDAAKASS